MAKKRVSFFYGGTLAEVLVEADGVIVGQFWNNYDGFMFLKIPEGKEAIADLWNEENTNDVLRILEPVLTGYHNLERLIKDTRKLVQRG